MKLITGLVITGVVIAGASALVALNRASEKVATEVTARVHKLTTSGVVIVLGYNIKNPTRAALKMSVPLITISYNGSQLAQSSLANTTIPNNILTSEGHIRIEKFKETGMIYTEVTLPYFSLISAGYDLVKVLKGRLSGENTSKVKFTVDVTSQAFTALGSFAYDDKQIIAV